MIVEGVGGLGMQDTGEDRPDALLYGVVRFEPGVTRRVRDIVITFDSPESADRFALEHAWGEDYQVAALRFFVEELPVTPPAGSRLHLDRALARVRRGGVL